MKRGAILLGLAALVGCQSVGGQRAPVPQGERSNEETVIEISVDKEIALGAPIIEVASVTEDELYAIVGDRLARINLRKGSTAYTYKLTDLNIEALVYVAAEKSVALLTNEDGVVIISSTGDVIAKMPHPPGKQIVRIAAHPTLPILAIVLRESGEFEEGWIVDAKTLKTTKDLEQQLTGQIGFSPDGSELISWQEYGVSRIRVRDWKVYWTPVRANGGRPFRGLTSIFVGEAALGVFVGDGAGGIYHLKPGSKQITAFEQVHNYDVTSLTCVGDRLVSSDSGSDSKIVVWDVAKGKKLIVRAAIRGGGFPVLFAKQVSSSHFVVGYGDGLLQMWKLK